MWRLETLEYCYSVAGPIQKESGAQASWTRADDGNIQRSTQGITESLELRCGISGRICICRQVPAIGTPVIPTPRPDEAQFSSLAAKGCRLDWPESFR